METGVPEYYVLTNGKKTTIITKYKKAPCGYIIIPKEHDRNKEKVEKKRSTPITLKEKTVHRLKGG